VNDYDQQTVGQAIVRAYHAIWRRNIHDDGGPAPGVTKLFDANGWESWLRDPDLGGCPDGYERPPDPDYCGHGAACALRRIGDHLKDGQCVGVSVDPAICEEVMPSTYRLGSGQKWSESGYDRPAAYDARRSDDLPPIRVGDVLVVETSVGRPYGDHITVARAPAQSGEVRTFEANAPGERFDGSHGKGVVKASRPVDDIRQIIRIDHRHLVESV